MNIYHRIKRLQLLLIMAMAWLACSLAPPTALGHASLVKAVPEPGSELQASPPTITLTFNERLDNGLFWIKVIDQTGSQVTSNSAVMTADQTVMQLDMPILPEGLYIITYHVISADGHPVSGSYPMTIGNSPSSANPPIAAADSELHHQGLSGAMGGSELIRYLSRALWYAALLALAGWVLWLRLPVSGGAAARQSLSFWTLNLQRLFLVALLFMIFTHMEELLGNGGLDQLVPLFTQTSIGLTWTITLVLSLLGFILLQRFAIADVGWVAALLIAESISGHALAFTPQWGTILLDLIHLAASSIWVGGLLLLAVKWRQGSDTIAPFLRAFSNAAFLSILVLAVSGSASILLFLPNLRYLTYSQWGNLLLVKIGLVFLVIAAAGCLRFVLAKKGVSQARLWFKIDFSLMLAIVVIVGFITYMAPIPPNEPLKWHVMGETVHMSAEITPKSQGENTFLVKVWLPEKAGKPKQVQLLLHHENDEQIAPIQVPLTPFEDQTLEESFGFPKYSYKAKGAYLPLRGNWRVEVRVMDSEDNEKVYEKEVMVY